MQLQDAFDEDNVGLLSLIIILFVCKTGKTTAIRPAAARETGVFQHHGDPIEGPLEIIHTSQHYRIE